VGLAFDTRVCGDLSISGRNVQDGGASGSRVYNKDSVAVVQNPRKGRQREVIDLASSSRRLCKRSFGDSSQHG